MRDVILKTGLSPELETALPIDRCVTIDDNNVVYLCDTMFTINEKDIKEVLNAK